MEELDNGASKLSHFDEMGQARMVDIGGKTATRREAIAQGAIYLSQEALARVREGTIAKGDVLGVARIAGILAAKKVHELIPLAHPLAIDKASIEFIVNDATTSILIRASIGITGKTGVEMEALTAVSIAALTIYDMCKSVDKGMKIDGIMLLSKEGGKGGTYKRT